jgi:hypothetical protein
VLDGATDLLHTPASNYQVRLDSSKQGRARGSGGLKPLLDLEALAQQEEGPFFD